MIHLSDLDRILQLAGLLMEKTTPAEARAIFRSHGASEDVMVDATKLKRFRNSFLAKGGHTDKGGDLKAAQEINDAYDVLSKEIQNGSSYSSSPHEPTRREQESDDAPWAQAGWSGGMRNSSSIHRRDYSDVNFIKKRMWELSGKSSTQYTVTNFDGRYTRGTWTVFGNEQIFPEMAKAMLQWENFHRHKAILIQKRGDNRKVYIVWANGSYVSPPHVIERDEDGYFGNDHRFLEELNEVVERL